MEAVYDNEGTQNPLIEALPGDLDAGSFYRQIRCCPPPPLMDHQMALGERKQGITVLPTVFVPLDYMYYVYDSLCRMLRSSYYTLTSRESVKRMNELFISDGAVGGYGTQAQSGALLGTPGLGKTSTLKRCLMLIPQVIAHEKYLDKPFFCKQVLWLFVECPSDASQKTMAYNIVHALDRAVGSNHLDYLMRTHSNAASAVATYIKVLCLTYHVGLLVIDEIQNVVATAQRTNRIKPLIRFLTELTNDSCTAIYFTGTTLAETVFQSEEYLRRRTRGPRLLPFKPDSAYRGFLQELWPYQYTPEQAVLTDKLANQIYDYSGGIPAYISKLLEEAQAQYDKSNQDMGAACARPIYYGSGHAGLADQDCIRYRACPGQAPAAGRAYGKGGRILYLEADHVQTEAEALRGQRHPAYLWDGAVLAGDAAR